MTFCMSCLLLYPKLDKKPLVNQSINLCAFTRVNECSLNAYFILQVRWEPGKRLALALSLCLKLPKPFDQHLKLTLAKCQMQVDFSFGV